MPNYKALNSLAEVRDWVRDYLHHDIPDAIVDEFNQVAKSLGASADWMMKDEKSWPKNVDLGAPHRHGIKGLTDHRKDEGC